jgi:Flp pilus assembly protein TadD
MLTGAGAATSDPCAGSEPSLEEAGIALDEGRWDDAESSLHLLEGSHPDCGRVLVGLARVRAGRGDPSEAERLFSRALNLAPDDAVVHAHFANLQLSRGLRSQAEYLVSEAITLDPQCAEALVVQGALLGLRGLFGEARSALEKAVALDPANAEARHQLGVWFFRVNLFDQAARHFETAVSLNPHRTQSFGYLGISLEMLGDAEGAERAYRSALKAAEGPFSDPSLDFNIGRFLLKQGRLEESRPHLDRAVAMHSRRRGPRYERAKLHLNGGELQAAREDAERALALGLPGDRVLDLQVYFMLTTIYSRLGETELARQYAQKAREAEKPDYIRDRQR